MKKIAILVAMLAMMLVAASPAFAFDNFTFSENVISDGAFSDNDVEQSANLSQTIDAGGDVEDVSQEVTQSAVSPDIFQSSAQSIFWWPWWWF